MLSAYVSSILFPLTFFHYKLFLLPLCVSDSLSVVNNMSEDIEDKVWRAEVEEYLQAYPNPIFVVMRVGQDSKVERDGKMEQCTVSQVDSSLIQICYKVRGWFSLTWTLGLAYNYSKLYIAATAQMFSSSTA